MNEFGGQGEAEPYPIEFPEIELDGGSTDKAIPLHIEVNEPAVTPKDGFTSLPSESNSAEHPEVKRYRQERDACSIQLPDYKVDGGFTIRNKLVHFDLDGKIVEGESPYDGVDDFARDGLRQANEQRGQAIGALLDAPNINDKYREVIEEVSDSKGTDTSQAKILPPAVYDELCATQPALEEFKHAPGFKKFGLTIIKFDQKSEELYGDRLVRHLLYHEGNHPGGKGEDITWYTVPSITPEGGIVAHESSSESFGGFASAVSNVEPLEFRNQGEMIEEGYAELRALMEANDFTVVDKSAPALVGIRPDGTLDRIIDNDTSDYPYVIPKEFAQATSDDGEVFTVGGHYAPAAYALYQLNQRCDGEILSNLELAREDPQAFDNVITSLEKVRPGLFRELYDLQRGEFHKSLWLIDPERPE